VPLLLLISLAGQLNAQLFGSKTKRPSWVDNLPVNDILLQAVGVAEDTGQKEKDQQRADDNAIAGVVQQINAQVVSQVQQFYEEKSTGTATANTEVYRQVTAVYASEVIKGIRISSRYYDKQRKLYYSLAVLPKAELERQFREKALRVTALCANYHRLAQQFLRQGQIYAALEQYGRALGELVLGQAFLKKKLEGDLDGNGNREMLQPRLESELSRILGGLYFFAESGSGQQAVRHRGLPEPLVGRVEYRTATETRPVSGLPVVFEFLNAEGLLSGKVITDAAGRFTGYVQRVDKAQAEVGLIRAHLFLPGLEPFKPQLPLVFKRLAETGCTFTFKIDVAVSVRLFVGLYEEMDGEPVRNSPTTASLVRALVAKNFTVMDYRGLPATVDRAAVERAVMYGDARALGEQLRGIVDYVIVGSLISATSAAEPGGLYFARADADVRVIKLSDGQVVASASINQLKAAGDSAQRANQNALRKCSRQVIKRVVSGLSKALE